MLAMAAGVVALGGRVIDLPETATLDETAALIAKHRPRFAFTCGMHHRDAIARGFLAGCLIPLVVLDCGYFNRSKGAHDLEGYNQIGINRLNWVPRTVCDASRWNMHGIELAPPVQDRPKAALIIGQVPGDSQHHLSEQRLNAWLSEHAATLVAHGFRLFYRPHPMHVMTKVRIAAAIVKPEEESLAASLARVQVAISYNSTAGLEALISGVRVICSPTAHYAHCADLKSRATLLQHLHRLAWTQWTCAELRSGAALQWLNSYALLLP